MRLRSLFLLITMLLAFPSLSQALPETSLYSTFEDLAIPYFESGQSGLMMTPDRVQIHYRFFLTKQVPAKGILVIASGRSEFMRKYAELIYDLRDAGYNIYIYDHRGQGESSRLLADPLKGHVGNFQNYVDDLGQFIDYVIEPLPSDKVFLLAHSMGAAAATRYAIQNPKVFTAMVLSSPMYQINLGDYLQPAVFSLLGSLLQFGQGEEYVPGLGPSGWFKSFQKDTFTTSFERKNYLDRELARDPAQGIGNPTNRWVYEAIANSYWLSPRMKQLTTPTLILQAENEAVVNPQTETDYCRQTPACEIISMKASKHEVLMETDIIRDQALRMALDFFKRF